MRFLIVPLATVLLAASSWAVTPVNFKAITVLDKSGEGPETERKCIAIGHKKIAFRATPNCDLSAAPDALTIFLNNKGLTGQFTVTNSAFTPGTDFASSTESYYDAVEASLPKEKEKPEFLGSDFKSYNMNERTGLAFTWSYQLFGKQVRRQVAYINIDADHQVCLTILSDDTSWDKTLAQAVRFMNSWYWLGGS